MRTHTLQAGEQTAGKLGDEERVEKISRKSRNDHERGPLHSAGLPARYRRSTLDGVREQTESGWDGPKYGVSWASQPARSSTTTQHTLLDFMQGWRVVILLLVWDKLIVRYMFTKVGQATHHLVCIRKTHTLDVHCLFARLVKLLAVYRNNV
jgi:hypothetical protein